MAEYEITMTRSPDLSDDEISHRLAQVYSFLIELGPQANSNTPAESAGTEAGASDGNSPVASRQPYDTPAFHQEQA